MLTYEEIMKYCADYKIEKGIVYNKKSNQPLTDENEILKVKLSILIIKEARETYQFHMSQFGSTCKTQEDYHGKIWSF